MAGDTEARSDRPDRPGGLAQFRELQGEVGDVPWLSLTFRGMSFVESQMSFQTLFFLWFICAIMKRRERQTEGWKSKDLKVSLARKEFLPHGILCFVVWTCYR